MLSFASSNLFSHKKPVVLVRSTMSTTPEEIAVNPMAAPVIQAIEIPTFDLDFNTPGIDFDSARVDWDVFMSLSISAYCTVQVYTYSEENPYSNSLLRYNTTINVTGNKRLYIRVTNLEETTTYRVRIQATAFSVVDSQPRTSAWVEEMFTTTEIPENFTGSHNGFYYKNGVKTTLNVSGTGFWNNVYYMRGKATQFEYIECMDSWVGYFEGSFYVDFYLYNGLFDCSCCTEEQKQNYNGNYYYGVERPSNWTGYGFAPSYAPTNPWMRGTFGYSVTSFVYGSTTTYYTAFVPYTGFANNTFYVNGVATPFDSQGSGSITAGNTTYNFSNGVPISGNRNGKYYIGGVETSLSADGTGTWNGRIYNKGGFVSMVNTPYFSGTGSIEDYSYYGSSFGSGITYG